MAAYVRKESFFFKMAALSMVLVSESISSTMILPFVGLFVASLQNIDPDEAGFLSGILVSVFQLGQILTGKMWGRMSDRFGRKPMIQLGLFFNALVALFFGVSPSIEFCILMRFLHGCANGNVLVAKTVIADITDKTNESIGFSAICLFWGVGSIVGPTLGGLLYNPVKTPCLAQFFAPDDLVVNFFVVHPAILPTLFIVFFSLLTLFSTCILLPETSKSAVDPLFSLCCSRRQSVMPLVEETVVVEDEDGDNGGNGKDHSIDDMHSRKITLEEMSGSGGGGVFRAVDTRDWDFSNNNNSIGSSNNGGGAVPSISQEWESVGCGGAAGTSPHYAVPIENIPMTTRMRNRRCGTTLEGENNNGYKPISEFGYAEALRCSNTRVVLLMYMCISSAECALLEIIPLWSIASTVRGGLSLTSHDVGLLLGISAVACVIANISFSWLSRWIQNNRCIWDFSIILWAVASIAMPCIVLFPPGFIFTSVTLVNVVREVALSWNYSLIYLFVARSAPEAHVGSMNGVAQSVSSFARMLTMLVFPPLFAWSLHGERSFPFNHHFVFWLTILPLLFSFVLSTYLPLVVLGT